MGGGPVRVGDGKLIIYGIIDHVIIIRIVDLFVHDRLHLRVLGGVDFQAAGEQEV